MNFKPKRIAIIVFAMMILSVIGGILSQVFSATDIIGAYKPYYNRNWEVYEMNSSEVWKLGRYASTSSADNTIDYTDSIYCLDKSRGFSGPSGVAEKVEYDRELDIRLPADFQQIFPNAPARDNQRQILWILDNMFVKDVTATRTTLLNAAQAYTRTDPDFAYDFAFTYLGGNYVATETTVAPGRLTALTEQHANEVIEIIQQYALWHFIDGFTYGTTNITLGGNNMPWTNLSDARDEALALYNYLIAKAEECKDTYVIGTGNKYVTPNPIQLSTISQTASVRTIGGADYYVVGPFQYQENGGLYNITGYQVIDQNNTVIASGKMLDSLTSTTLIDPSSYTRPPQTDFFVAIPSTTVGVTKLGVKINYSYYAFNENTSKFLSKTGAYATTQPIIMVKKIAESGSDLQLRDLNINTKFGIRLTKVDADNVATKIQGVKFELSSSKLATAIELTTDVNGVINFSDITVPTPAGTHRYTLTEKGPAPSGWILNPASISLDITFNANGRITEVTKVGGTGSNATITSPTGIGEFVEVALTVTNVKSYGFELIKQDATDNTNKLNGAEFDIEAKTDTGVVLKSVINSPTSGSGVDKGKIKLSDLDFTNKVTFTIKEKVAPTSYVLDDTVIKFTIQRNVSTQKLEVIGTPENISISKINTNNGNGPVSITIDNTRISDEFNFKLIKVDERSGVKLSGATFEITSVAITPSGSATKITDTNGEFTIASLKGTAGVSTDIEITIKETVEPNGYIYKVQEHKIKINRAADGTLSVIDNAGLVVVASNTTNTISVTVNNYRDFDLALRKFITEVNHATVPSREPVVNVNTTAKTITYTHTKQPISVKNGDMVTYTIRVYNEGNISGYVQEIKDFIGEGLEFVPPAESAINAKYGWTQPAGQNYVITNYRAKGETNEALLPEFDFSKYVSGNKNTEPKYTDVEIEYKVVESNGSSGKILTNIAEISQDYNDYNDIPDIDSIPGNGDKNPGNGYTDNSKGGYKEDQNNKFNPNPPDNEDDIDVDHVKLLEYDLALRKFIVSVNPTAFDSATQIPSDGIVTPSRTPNPIVDSTTGTVTKYEHPKNAVLVKDGDVVVYAIRVYNEGQISGHAEEVKDILPDGLTYIENHPLNQYYRWTASSDGKTLRTDYLSKDVGENAIPARNNIINAFDYPTMTTPHYKTVYVACLVEESKATTNILTNIAEISKDDGDDIDSEPDDNKPGDDDIDEEKVTLQKYDLALRKYITKVNEANVTDRVPEPIVNTDGVVTKYDHKKTPVPVRTDDIVTYTIRVFNEGKIDGYAEEIKDNIPDGLEYIDNQFNRDRGWEEYTDSITGKKCIKTDYLSKANGVGTPNSNLIKAFDYPTMSVPDSKYVEVQFKVVEPNSSNRIIINIAEIKNDDGEDIDSEPDNNVETEDDLDKEYLELQEFDLALKKWVTQARVTVDGKETIIESGHTGDENPEPPLKVDLKDSKLSKTTVKFVYKIKVINEGDIAGYAMELKDYIPAGLKFVKEDNPDWEEVSEGVVKTDKLNNTLLQPGESATVEIILTWIPGETNLGLKVNWAEISEDADENKKPIEDRDSTPNNKKEGEDDIDQAPVLLSIKTGQEEVMYFSLSGVCLAMLGGSIYLIKRKVL